MVATTKRIALCTRLLPQAQLAPQLGGGQVSCIHLAADVEVLRTRQPADHDRIEARVTHETLCDLECVAVIARERNADALAGPVSIVDEVAMVDRVERPYQANAREKFRRRHAGA